MNYPTSNWEARDCATHQLQAILDPEYIGRVGTDGIVKPRHLATSLEDWASMKDLLSAGDILGYTTKYVGWANRQRKDWCEGSAAKARQRLDNSVRQHVDPIAKKASKFLDTGKELNETCTKSVKRMVIAYEQKVNTLNDSAESITRNVKNITGSAAKASEAVSSSAHVVEETARTMSESIRNLSEDVNGVFVRLNSNLGAIIGLLGQAVAQMHVMNESLQGIKDELSAQNTLISSGGSGPDGFAKVVYDFAQLHIKKAGGDNHRFFLWHPDNSWHGCFENMLEDKPLDAAFCAYSDNLDRLCVCMRTARQAQSRNCDLIFHLLIPTWYPITVTEPLHFPDDLQPLRVEGSRHGGGGWGVNAACLSAGMGIGSLVGGPLVAIPIWWGSMFTVGAQATFIATSRVYDLLSEEAPRILGSEERLKMPDPF